VVDDGGLGAIPKTIEWRDGIVRMIDQRRLPSELCFLEAGSVYELCNAISSLAVRGAPALGVAGAMGVALAAYFGEDPRAAAERIIATRPTAVNLRWGVERALSAADPVAEAKAILAEDIAVNRQLGRVGARLLPTAARVLTHCNAGSLACGGYGTALGVIRAAHEAGLSPVVCVDETRPLLQGSRLTAWELSRLGIPATVLVDSAAASLMARAEVDCVIVGADRIAANGDVANKIGTYSLAVLAHYHHLPFYVAAPLSTVDFGSPNGAAIPLEQRGEDEVSSVGDQRLTSPGTRVINPAFDVTPAKLVTGIVTEAGVATCPYRRSLVRLAETSLRRPRRKGERRTTAPPSATS